MKFRFAQSPSKNSQRINSLENAYCKQKVNTLTVMKIPRAVKHDNIPKQIKMITFRGRKHKLMGRNTILSSPLMTQDCITPTKATKDSNYLSFYGPFCEK